MIEKSVIKKVSDLPSNYISFKTGDVSRRRNGSLNSLYINNADDAHKGDKCGSVVQGPIRATDSEIVDCGLAIRLKM